MPEEYNCLILKSNLFDLDKIQSKLMKASLGLPSCCRTTPLLQALNVKPVSSTIMMSSLRLLKSCLFSTSLSRKFYTSIMTQDQCYTEGKLYWIQLTEREKIGLFTYQKHLYLQAHSKAHKRLFRILILTRIESIYPQGPIRSYSISNNFCMGFIAFK